MTITLSVAINHLYNPYLEFCTVDQSWPETTNCFKNRLDKFWNNQEKIFDYKAELTGIGNRSNII